MYVSYETHKMSTLRHTHPNPDCEVILEYTKEAKQDGSNWIIPTTVLDEQFPFDTHPSWGSSYYITLDKKNRWESVKDVCEKASVKTQTNTSPTHVTTSYQLPVIGERIQPCLRVKWKNKLYKSDQVYLRDGQSFRELPFTYSELPRIDGRVKPQYTSKSRLGTSQIGRSEIGLVSPRFSSYFPNDVHAIPVRQTPPSVSNVEIDLGKNYQVTHVSTMGRTHEYYRFPNREESQLFQPPSQLSLTYVVENDKSWWTHYRLEVRVEHGKEWFRVGTFLGNSNRTHEVVHCIDCVPIRFLRFIPQKWVGSTACRIGIFGTEGEDGKNLNPTSEQTVTYSIIQSRLRKRLPDSQTKHQQASKWWAKDTAQRKQRSKGKVHQELIVDGVKTFQSDKE